MPVFLSSKAENGNKVFNDVSEEINIPILHIADAAAAAVRRDNIKKVGLLGTRFTMTQDFIKDRLGNCFISINTSLKWCVKAKKILGGMEETSI